MIKIFCLIILSILFSCGKPVKNDLSTDSPNPSCQPPIDINNFTILNEINDFKFEDKLNYNSDEDFYHLDDDENYLEDSYNLKEKDDCEFLYYDVFDSPEYLEIEENCIVN